MGLMPAASPDWVLAAALHARRIPSRLRSCVQQRSLRTRALILLSYVPDVPWICAVAAWKLSMTLHSEARVLDLVEFRELRNACVALRAAECLGLVPAGQKFQPEVSVISPLLLFLLCRPCRGVSVALTPRQ